MQFHCVLLVVAFIQVTIAFLKSDSLEESVTLKFEVANKLRENLSKILNRLPTKDYEVAQSIRLLQDFFNNGGSLLDSLENLPGFSHISTNRQIDGIFFSMEDHLPRFLLPAVSVLRKFLLRESLEVYESLHSGNDTLIADPFDEISLTDLRNAGISINLPSGLKSGRHFWPDFVGSTTAAIISGLLKPSGKFLGFILSNVIIPAEDPWTKEAVVLLINKFSTMESQLEDLEWTLNPYNLLQRALLTVAKDNSMMDTVKRIFPFLKLSDISTSDLNGFVNNGIINFTLLVSSDSTLGDTEEGKLLLSAIENGDLDINEIFYGFQIFDYSERKELLIAVISRLRRHQPRLNSGLSDIIENCYSRMMSQYNHRNWQQVPRNPNVIKSILQGMKSDNKSPRVNRLIGDIKDSLEQSMSFTSWHKSLAYMKETECYGPSCLVLRTLQGLQDAGVIKNHALQSTIIEFLDVSSQNDTYECSDLSSMNHIYEYYEESPKKNLNLTNILQALPELEIHSKEYKLLCDTLSQENLEQMLGAKINVTEHPTRAKMLSWILQSLENQESVDKNIRQLATEFVSEISYEGYGAVNVEV